MSTGAETRAGIVGFKDSSLSMDRDIERQIQEFDYTQDPEFSEETHPAKITETDIIWGDLTEAIYQGTETRRGYKRLPPFRRVYFGGDRIEYYGKRRLGPNEDPPTRKRQDDLRQYGVVPVETITAEDLAKERGLIPPAELHTIHAFKVIEDDVPYFVSGAKGMFIHVKGLSRAYGQWDLEETEHSEALGFILEHAGGWDRKSVLDKEYYLTQMQTWEPPFKKNLEIVAYARKQERNTHGNYNALARVLREHGAHNSALIVTRIGSDEQFHGEGFEDYMEAYASISPEHRVEAAKAVLRVAYHFRMPSQHLMRDRARDVKNIVSTIGYSEAEVENMLRATLNEYSFIPKPVIEPLVASYTEAEKKRTRPIFEKQIRDKVIARRQSRLDTTQNGNG